MRSIGKKSIRRIPRLGKVLVASGIALAAVLTATALAFASTGGPKGGALNSEAELAPPVSSSPSPALGSAMPTTPSPSPTPTATKAKAKATKKAKPKAKSKSPRVVGHGVCQASYYGDPQQTASGETFNPNALTAANRTLPFGTHVRVTNTANGRSVVVRINDRGPYAGGRCLDLSTAAMKAVGGTGAGVITAKYEVLAS